MYKIATLLKRKDSLDVCVESQEHDLEETAKSSIRNLPEQCVTGMICFNDTRPAKNIIMDFAYKYRAVHRMGEDREGKYYFARYGLQMESTLPTAFVVYFLQR
jgi:hypothetical protein